MSLFLWATALNASNTASSAQQAAEEAKDLQEEALETRENPGFVCFESIDIVETVTESLLFGLVPLAYSYSIPTTGERLVIKKSDISHLKPKQVSNGEFTRVYLKPRNSLGFNWIDVRGRLEETLNKLTKGV